MHNKNVLAVILIALVFVLIAYLSIRGSQSGFRFLRQ